MFYVYSSNFNNPNLDEPVEFYFGEENSWRSQDETIEFMAKLYPKSIYFADEESEKEFWPEEALKDYPEISKFVLARLEEIKDQVPHPIMGLLDFIVHHHQSWPTIVEGPEEVSFVEDYDIDNISYRISREYDLVMMKVYVQKFGQDPPTAPIMRHFAQIFKTHPDFNPSWA